jgi:hypothetical protein
VCLRGGLAAHRPSRARAARRARIQAVFEARTRPGSPMAFAAFDLLEIDGYSALAEPWTARRKRLEDPARGAPTRHLPRAGDRGRPRALGHVGGPGRRRDRPEGADLGLSPRHPLASVAQAQAEAHARRRRDGRISGAHRIGRLGRSRDARVPLHALALRRDMEIRQAVRVPRDLPFDLTIGARLALVCWGVMPSGMLRHPVLAGRGATH